MTLRRACREHAEHFIDVQTKQFSRLGVFGMWDRPYTSMEYKYEAEIIRIFKRLVENGYVYRGLRPVLWSPTSKTALADTEIVYKAHTSPSIYVRFALRQDPKSIFDGLTSVYTVIWTTTPWTIPANLAVAVHPKLEYVLVAVGENHYLILKDLLGQVAEKCGWGSPQVVRSFSGSELEGVKFTHPLVDRESVTVLADYVTTEDGTGVVHTAPGHGRDDFYTGQKYGLEVLCPVSDSGVMTEEAGEFAGLYYSKANKAIVERLAEVEALLHQEEYQHQYPHAERDGNPVIFRATEQWFIGMDLPFHGDPSKSLRQKMLEEIQAVEWRPEGSIGRITTMVANRPDWCVSRQRPWGVGIPIFYGAESGEPVLDPQAIEHVAKVVEDKGSDSWYELSPDDFLPAGYRHPKTGETSFRKEVDVFDVWFDSACTHLAVLEGNVEPRWQEDLPCDLFLEGSDQHRGWFNVSMVVGVGCRGHAPYKAVVTHGMVVDEKGEKMSKRLGNAVDPVEASDQVGADILRYWAASIDYEHDAPCSKDLLTIAGENYRSVRNTLRFLLGNLADYDAEAEVELSLLDQWVMQEANSLVEKVVRAYSGYEFNKALSLIHNFCVNELSKFYLDAIKDTMYCDGSDWPTRRGSQRACHYVLDRITGLVAPILCHTAEEVYARVPAIKRLDSVHMDVFRAPSFEADPQVTSAVNQLQEIRGKVFADFEQWKVTSGVKNSQDVELDLVAPQSVVDALEQFGNSLHNIFKMAQVRFSVGEYSVSFTKSELDLCERSRLRRPDVVLTQWNGQEVMLSSRDRQVLGVS
ncbi:isoleucine--tRNA ligase [Kamptonema cortianum]|nr:isoleucine--tRNA ligase [Kamptonema cortianum]